MTVRPLIVRENTVRGAVRGVLRGGGGGLDPLVFHALTYDETTYEYLGVKTGTGDLTEANTSTRYYPDHENVWREFGSTVAGVRGGRVVENLCLHSNDFSSAAWSNTSITVTSGISDPGGGTSASTLTATSASAFVRQDLSSVMPQYDKSVSSVWIRRRTGSGDIALYTGSGFLYTDITSQVTTSWKRFSVNSTNGSTTSFWGLIVFTSGDEIDVWHYQAESANGRGDATIPSEYIPTTSASAHKVYANVNGNTVASNIVTEATGVALADLPWLGGQKACTNEITYSRDLTNAAWTTVGTPTTTYDQVGLTGAANTATLLDDSNAGTTEQAYEDVTIANDSNIHILRILIKKDTDETRFAGFRLSIQGGTLQTREITFNTKTGATDDKANTGTTALEIVDTGAWWDILISVTNNTSGNTTARIHIFPAYNSTITNGQEAAATGSIIVGNVELHQNTSIENVRGSSPIFTAGSAVTINASDTDLPDDNHSASQGGYFADWTPQFATAEVSGDIEILSLNDAAGLLYYDATNSLLKSTDGTNTASVALTVVAGTTYKIWVAYGDIRLQVGVDATTGTAGTFDGAFATGTKMEIINPSANTTLIRDVRGYNSDFDSTVTTLQALAA